MTVFNRVLAIAYGLYAWLVFLLFLSVAIIFAVILPGVDRRRRWVTAVTHGVFSAMGIGATVSGIDKFPAEHCVVVANHASYIDGVVLQGFLPPRLAYVIKGEVRGLPLIHFLLRRVGCRFVERFDKTERARDTRGLVKAAQDGESLAFFPEGTFISQPGLSRFHAGAFTAAVRAKSPVVPVVIRGSRDILPAKTFLPRRGYLKIDILSPVAVDHAVFQDKRELAEFVRQRMLEVLGEPDLCIAQNQAEDQVAKSI